MIYFNYYTTITLSKVTPTSKKQSASEMSNICFCAQGNYVSHTFFLKYATISFQCFDNLLYSYTPLLITQSKMCHNYYQVIV